MEPNQWNTAAVREWELVELLNDIDIATMADHPQFTEWFTDDFVREDRRGLTGAPTVDALGFVEQMRAWFEIGAGAPTFAPREVVAVAGDRLVVIRISVSFSGENEVEMLHLVLMDEQVVRQQRIVSFDVEARDLAIEELERLAVDMGAEGRSGAPGGPDMRDDRGANRSG